jgi:acetyltransferase-like isoleucine patch superfamily enzyme
MQKIRFYLSIILYRYFKAKKFKEFQKGIAVFCPLKIEGLENIIIKKNVSINYRAWITAKNFENEDCEIIFGEGTTIGNYNHIYATKSIVFGENVLTADRVYISDNLHSYQDITRPIIRQPIKQIGCVEIGDGTWLGENVCVLGVKIGKNCVIGANSVVTRDIPDFCVAVGSPAKVIKRFNLSSNTWEKI